jgi:hypothetical protein
MAALAWPHQYKQHLFEIVIRLTIGLFFSFAAHDASSASSSSRLKRTVLSSAHLRHSKDLNQEVANRDLTKRTSLSSRTSHLIASCCPLSMIALSTTTMCNMGLLSLCALPNNCPWTTASTAPSSNDTPASHSTSCTPRPQCAH